MKLDTALNVIEHKLEEILENELTNIYASVEDPAKQIQQLETGFDRLNAFEAIAIATAKRKFKP